MIYRVFTIHTESDLKNIDFTDRDVDMFILDCHKTITLRSENLAIILMNRDKLCVCGLSKLNQDIFDILHLTGRIKQFDTVKEAVAYCEE